MDLIITSECLLLKTSTVKCACFGINLYIKYALNLFRNVNNFIFQFAWRKRLYRLKNHQTAIMLNL